MMRLAIVLGVAARLVGQSAYAQAQPGAGATPDRGYLEAVAQSALSNVTSQSYGAEGGVTVWGNLQIFIEAGRTTNVATQDLGSSAQQITTYLSTVQSAAVSVNLKEPVSFGAAGVRLRFPVGSKASPYVMGGIGFAKVTKDVHFLLGGSDATNNLAQYGVTLGSDLTGSYTKPMLVLGGGVAWTAWQRLVIDFQYRYGRIFPEDQTPSSAAMQGINVSRVGAGVGVVF
jgi:opacity protein-like surface antigen